jgi:hypothetical protein
MAKVQGKKAATSVKKKAAAKAVAKAKSSKKPAPKKPSAKPKAAAVAKKAPKAAPKKPVSKKPAPKPAAKTSRSKKPVVAKKTAPPSKITTAPVPKPAARTAKIEKAPESKVKTAPKTPAKVAATPAPARPADEKKRRRSRLRVTSNGPATAAWFSQGDRPRSSSFIPAPPRAEAPSLVAAPPASSDRLVGSHELTEFAVRTVPVRIDIEAGGGRIYLTINPNETTLKVGEGIEWDFRYLGGADVVIEEMIIEFAKPSPFPTTVFRSRRPGAARPHRQLSGPVQASAAGKRLQYTIRSFNAFKTEMAVAKPALVVTN